MGRWLRPNEAALREFSAWFGTAGARVLLHGTGDELTLTAIGAVWFARNVGKSIDENGLQYPLALVADHLQAADITWCDLESPLGVRGTPIAYSLGNFVTDQIQDTDREGMILDLQLGPSGVLSARTTPVGPRAPAYHHGSRPGVGAAGEGGTDLLGLPGAGLAPALALATRADDGSLGSPPSEPARPGVSASSKSVENRSRP